jgi:hypothetical protein
MVCAFRETHQHRKPLTGIASVFSLNCVGQVAPRILRATATLPDDRLKRRAASEEDKAAAWRQFVSTLGA